MTEITWVQILQYCSVDGFSQVTYCVHHFDSSTEKNLKIFMDSLDKIYRICYIYIADVIFAVSRELCTLKTEQP